ncbi:hypothetical protein C7H09_06425 [Marinobacter fuscus]|uniref:Uncharacterized protein n=1 Tax=Marinobacter fuscus TaxID=2109942 RepID=A0A2T1KKG7_9GAMM|nr:hypothetical protein [Marinobacter fuscus]PSF10575.1 hypothetical protein C7H09_06425 [Marinobacter fuscus]
MNAVKFQASQPKKWGRRSVAVGVIGASVLGSGAVSAADWTSMTTGLSFAGEESAIIAITGVLFTFYVVRKGANLLLSMIR